MFILGIVGSPRKNGRTNELVSAALNGAESEGADTKKIYLADFDVRPYMGAGGSIEAFEYCPEELSKICSEAEAIVLGAPVYWGDINGLTKDFMDTVRIDDPNGKYARQLNSQRRGRPSQAGLETNVGLTSQLTMPHWSIWYAILLMNSLC